MNIFLCHTPLHLIIAALELPFSAAESHIFVVEDVPGMHALARALFDEGEISYHMLPGAAETNQVRPFIALQRENYSRIRSALPNLAPSHLFVFFDQRAEAQALLNFRYQSDPWVTLLEDGLSIYKVASPFDHPYRRLVWNKLRFDLSWKGSRWLGKHPRINEIACFFPEQLRDDLKSRPIRSLSRNLGPSHLHRLRKLYGPPRFGPGCGIVAVPHPDYGLAGPAFDRFIGRCLDYFRRDAIKPIFKLHPRDTYSQDAILKLAPDAVFAPHHFPVELVMLGEPGIKALVGFRTSALHVASALNLSHEIFYYEPTGMPDVPGQEVWREFYRGVCVPSLPSPEYSK